VNRYNGFKTGVFKIPKHRFLARKKPVHRLSGVTGFSGATRFTGDTSFTGFTDFNLVTCFRWGIHWGIRRKKMMRIKRSMSSKFL